MSFPYLKRTHSNLVKRIDELDKQNSSNKLKKYIQTSSS